MRAFCVGKDTSLHLQATLRRVGETIVIGVVDGTEIALCWDVQANRHGHRVGKEVRQKISTEIFVVDVVGQILLVGVVVKQVPEIVEERARDVFGERAVLSAVLTCQVCALKRMLKLRHPLVVLALTTLFKELEKHRDLLRGGAVLHALFQ